MKPLFSPRFWLVSTLRITLNFIIQNLKNEEIGKNHLPPAYFNMLFFKLTIKVLSYSCTTLLFLLVRWRIIWMFIFVTLIVKSLTSHTYQLTLNFIIQNLKNEETGKNHQPTAYFNMLFFKLTMKVLSYSCTTLLFLLVRWRIMWMFILVTLIVKSLTSHTYQLTLNLTQNLTSNPYNSQPL